ncbi:Gfo/Idh/MocA family protein [Phytoactinopolyspora endophytica]|uniref:Gfo/Idh/MocA family protein n=1 Tax=Phytoactinopolyspora endophytica TaxID=1642495 RepID=UPI00101E1B70|nr:Gfo/Idh/MocA family oxidoreductase [Phytoactinopolyspora endophytica]
MTDRTNDIARPAPATTRIRVAVVGLGAIGQEHAAIVHGYPGSELAGVVEPQPEVCGQVASQYGVPAYPDIATVLADDAVDAVSLCTPDHLHFDDACQVIAAGKHLLLEKPIATTADEVDKLTQLTEDAEIVAMPGHTLRFEPRYHYAHSLVRTGALGRLSHGYLRRDNKVEVADRARGRVSAAFFLGVHDIDALMWITGQDIVEVQAMQPASTESTGTQSTAVLGGLRLADGSVVQIESAWNLPANFPTELDARFRLVGSDGEISIDSFDSGIHVSGPTFDLPMPAGTPMYGRPQGPLAVEIEAFIRACRGEIDLPITIREAAKAVKVLIALEHAVSTGSTVPVEPVALNTVASGRG